MYLHILLEVKIINISYRTKKLEKICQSLKEAQKQLGTKVGKNLILRIKQLKAFANLQMVPTSLPWRREKLTNYRDRWTIRIDSNFRLEFIALDINQNLNLIDKLIIIKMSIKSIFLKSKQKYKIITDYLLINSFDVNKLKDKKEYNYILNIMFLLIHVIILVMVIACEVLV